jgi:hypothetical protein
MVKINIFNYSNIVKEKSAGQEEITKWRRSLGEIYGTEVSRDALLDATRLLGSQKFELDKELEEIWQVQLSGLQENEKLLRHLKTLIGEEKNEMILESRIDTFHNIFVEKDEKIEELQGFLKKGDEEFAKLLNKTMLGFTFIFIVMVYLFLIK